MNTPPAHFWIQRILSALFILLLLAYITLSEPFFGIAIANPKLRIAVEAALLLTFLSFFYATTHLSEMRRPIVGLLIVAAWLVISNPTMSGAHGHSPPALIAKFAMLLLGAHAICNHRRLHQLCAWTWVAVWAVISLQTITSGLCYNLHLIDFGTSPFKSVGFFHPILGFINTWNFFGFIYGKPMGYLLEPIALGFCLGLNIVVSPSFLKPSHAKWFKGINLIAGLCVGSTAFYLFFLLFGLYQLMHRHLATPLLVVILGAIAAVFLGATIEYTSLKDRAFRLAIGMDALMQSNWKSLLFGNMNYLSSNTIPNTDLKTISSGFLTVLVQRGVPLLLFLCYLLHRYTRGNTVVLAYLLYYGLLLQYFWWPVAILFLVLLINNSGFGPDIPENCEAPRP